MRIFGSYLKARKKEALVFCIFTLIFAGVFLLYHVPVVVVFYAGALCAAVGLVFSACDLYRYGARLRLLRDLEKEITTTEEHLPKAQDGVCEAYELLVRRLFADKRQLEERWKKSYTDMMEYYTVWVHQIKTPIAAMRLKLQEREDREASALLADLNRIEQYVEMVLCYLRLDAGTTDLCIAEYDLDGIVKQAVRRFAGSFIGQKQSLCYEPLHYRVLTDEKWLLFVVEQVLSNALKYTREGQISITLEEDELVIRDTGIGIAAEDLPRVFDNGFTGYNGRSDKKASGIGLYLCRRICKNLGHSIRVYSVLGEGTAVYIGLSRQQLEVE